MKKMALLLTVLIMVFSVQAEERVLSLDDCIETALKNNTVILNARAMVEDYRLLKKVAQAEFLPAISARVGYTHSEQVSPEFTSFQAISPFSVFRYYGAGLSMNQTIWDGGASIANNKRAKSDYMSSRFYMEDTEQLLIYSVEETYLNLLKQKQLLTVYQETLNSSLEALKKAESMEAVGASSRTDVLKARVKVEDDRLNSIMAENFLEEAKANLNYLLGFDANNNIRVMEIGPAAPLSISYEEAVETALRNHPAMEKAYYDEKSAIHTISAAKSAIFPQVYGSYNFGTNSTDLMDFSDPFQNEYSWSAGITLSLNLFDGLASPSNLQRARVGRKSAQDNVEQIRRDVILEVKSAYLGLDVAEKSIAATTERVLSAEEDFKLSTARYELGAGTILEQIDAQVALTSARAQKIQAEYDARFAQSRLKKAFGQLK